MGIASAWFHVDSSNIHASQVTRTLVGVLHGLKVAFDTCDHISNCDVNRNIPRGVRIVVITTGYQRIRTILGCLQSHKTTATSPIQTQGLSLKKVYR